MTAKAEGAFRSTSGPNRPKVDADGRKDGDMKNGQDALREIFRLLKLEGNAAKSEVEDAGATVTLVADNGVGAHAYSFAQPRVRRNDCSRVNFRHL